MLIFALILSGYVFFRAVLPLRAGWFRKVLLGIAVLLIAGKFQLLHLIGGGMFFAPELPVWILALSAWLYAALFIFFFLLIAADICRLTAAFVRLCRGKSGTGVLRTIGNAVNLGLLTLSSLLSSYGMATAAAPPELRREYLNFSGLPSELDGLTVAVLADLHIDGATPDGRLAAVVERVNRLNPDLTFIVGDFVDGSVQSLKDKLAPLKLLRARYGVFGVPGNHEYYSGYLDWIRYLSGCGVVMLENSHRSVASGMLTVAGVTDRNAKRYRLPPPDVSAALSGAAEGSFIILLSHQPVVAAAAAKSAAALQLSGHTHGGMVRGLDALIAEFNGGFVAGDYNVGTMRLYVNRGTFIWSGFPIRIGVPGEITLLTLRSDLRSR